MSPVDLRTVWGDFSAGKIDSVASTLKTSQEEAVKLIGEQLVSETDKLLIGNWRYSFDVIVFAFLCSLVLVFIFVGRQSFPHGNSKQVVVTAAEGIPRYHVVTKSDIALQNVKTIDGSLGDVEKVLGHYAVEQINSKATILSGQLSSGTISPSILQGRQVLLLPIKGTCYKASEMPVAVSLYVSLKTTDGSPSPKSAVIRSAYILSCGADGDSRWAATALIPADANTIAGFLGNSEIFASEDIL